MIFFRLAMVAIAFAVMPVAYVAAESGPPAASDVLAEEELAQVALTDADMKGFIAVQTELLAMADQLEANDSAPKEDLRTKLDAVARRHGFKSFETFDNVAATIALVMEGVDPDTGNYTDPKSVIGSDIEDVKKDATLTEEERAEVIADLEEARQTTPDLQHPANVDMVRKYLDQIVKLVQ